MATRRGERPSPRPFPRPSPRPRPRPVFLRDIIITPELAGSEICLHDIDAERMEMNFRLAQIFVATTQADFRITQTLSLDEALHGADFIS